jgi:glycosyltransferase involved in cell wall biosynthesis
VKIAFLVPSLGDTEGQGSVDYELLKRAAAAGHEIDVYAGIVRPEAANLPGVRAAKIPRLPAWQFGNQLLSLAATSTLRAGRYDLVHADAGVTLHRADVMLCHTLSSRWLRMPEQIWREPGARGANNAAATKFKARLEIRQYKAARRVLANSLMTAADLAQAGVDPARIAVVPFGVDAGRFRPPSDAERAQARASFGIPPDAFVTLLVGAHGERKGLPLALASLEHATKQGRGEHLLVAGDLRGGRWERAAKQARLPVTMPGKLADARPAYWAADVLTAPSRYDAFGMAVLEAMASGLPVIVSAQTGARDCIEDAGIVLQEHSVPSLRAAIDALRGDEARREAMRKRARELALRRDWDTAGAILLQAYAAAAEERKSRETSSR